MCMIHLKVVFKVVKLFLLDRLVSHRVLNTARILLLDISILMGKKRKTKHFHGLYLLPDGYHQCASTHSIQEFACIF